VSAMSAFAGGHPKYPRIILLQVYCETSDTNRIKQSAAF
jgi:hypothetical protein